MGLVSNETFWPLTCKVIGIRAIANALKISVIVSIPMPAGGDEHGLFDEWFDEQAAVAARSPNITDGPGSGAGETGSLPCEVSMDGFARQDGLGLAGAERIGRGRSDRDSGFATYIAVFSQADAAVRQRSSSP